MKIMQFLRKLDTILDEWSSFLIPFAVLTLLKLPSFFEPYWYGDEAIYLTIGNALRGGERLYAEIIDHKTPLIYYLAMTPHQFWFRVLMFVWMAISTYLFYVLAKDVVGVVSSKVKKTGLLKAVGEWPTFVATLLFVLFTSLPSFEGNIPNGELFVMGFMLAGWWFLRKHPIYQEFLGSDQSGPVKTDKKPWLNLVLGGIFLALGILTKVPGLFDAVALMSVPALLIWQRLVENHRNPKVWWLETKQYWFSLGWMVAAVIGTILASILYFTLRGSLSYYIEFGLLYNFRYAAYWAIPETNPVIISLMTLPGKAAVAGGSLILMVVMGKFIPNKLQLILVWCWLALFGSLLSNRPYPHYFLQIAPALSLLLGYSFYGLLKRLKPSSLLQGNVLPALFSIWFLFVSGTAITSVGIPLTLERLGISGGYYLSFLQTITGKKSWTEYSNSFDSLVADNAKATPIIMSTHPKRIFIWGTNPSLYAQTQTYPTGRFTVAFHIKDFNAYDETFTSVVEQQPEFIVMMNQEQSFPKLQTYLQHNYIPYSSFDHFVLWRRLSGV